MPKILSFLMGRIMKKNLLTILTLVILSQTALAEWNPDGIPLQTINHGMVNGGIYVSGGHGMEYTTTYTQDFSVPNGTVKWARLYVSAKDTPWIKTSINGHLLGNYTNLATNPKVYANYIQDHSTYWAYYDNADEWIVNGTNTVTADLGTRVGFNTKSWGIMLLVVYEGGDNPEPIEYWINEGNPLLHGDHPPFIAYNNITNTSIGPIDMTGLTDAELWTAYIWGSEESEMQPHDTLLLNLDMIADDASDGAGYDDQSNSWRGACFDLKKWDITHSLAQNNIVSFDRGGDSLLCPVGTVLILKRASASRAAHLATCVLSEVSLNINPGTLAPGEQSGVQILTLSNTGTSTFIVTANITDTAIGLYLDGVLLNSDKWNAFSRLIVNGTVVSTGVVLDIPVDFTGIGIDKGKLIFWAEMT